MTPATAIPAIMPAYLPFLIRPLHSRMRGFVAYRAGDGGRGVTATTDGASSNAACTRSIHVPGCDIGSDWFSIFRGRRDLLWPSL